MYLMAFNTVYLYLSLSIGGISMLQSSLQVQNIRFQFLLHANGLAFALNKKLVNCLWYNKKLNMILKFIVKKSPSTQIQVQPA